MFVGGVPNGPAKLFDSENHIKQVITLNVSYEFKPSWLVPLLKLKDFWLGSWPFSFSSNRKFQFENWKKGIFCHSDLFFLFPLCIHCLGNWIFFPLLLMIGWVSFLGFKGHGYIWTRVSESTNSQPFFFKSCRNAPYYFNIYFICTRILNCLIWKKKKDFFWIYVLYFNMIFSQLSFLGWCLVERQVEWSSMVLV